MGNILNHNRPVFEFNLVKSDYWDFHLSMDRNGGYIEDGLVERCLVAYIDTNNPDCVWFGNLQSSADYKWEDAVNNGVDASHIGYTGMDNGLITFDKNAITNKEFLNLFFSSHHKIEAEDYRLILNKVEGNNQIYDYTNDMVFEDGVQVVRLNGGFFQGFFKLDGYDYQVLPSAITNGWSFEVTLKKSEFDNKNTTLNDEYPENKGIFLYIGTRAENKWWIKYDVEDQTAITKACDTEYVNDDYVNPDYYKVEDELNSTYLKPVDDDIPFLGNYFKEGYVKSEYYDKETCDICRYYVTDGYIAEDVAIDPDMEMSTEDGYNFFQPNIIEYTTDNKFLFYDRTPEGCQADKEGVDCIKVKLYDIKIPDIGNYFLLFDRTCRGYTTDSIDKLIDAESKKYDVLADIYRNALAFQIKDDGRVGYKYLVKACESEEEMYLIHSEFSNEGIVTEDNWHTIHIKIEPVTKKYSMVKTNCTDILSAESMKIYIYVDGKLVLVSKKLPMLNLKTLDDLYEKQEAVPFNISLGGGTQGLGDVIYLNYFKKPEYHLPLEKEFGGTFVGYIKSFKFYDCPLKFSEIDMNYQTEQNLFGF